MSEDKYFNNKANEMTAYIENLYIHPPLEDKHRMALEQYIYIRLKETARDQRHACCDSLLKDGVLSADGTYFKNVLNAQIKGEIK